MASGGGPGDRSLSGIVVVFNLDGVPVDPELLGRMAEAAAYRGPDGIRYRVDGNVGLAHLALNSTPESLQELQPVLSAEGMPCLAASVRTWTPADSVFGANASLVAEPIMKGYPLLPPTWFDVRVGWGIYP